jgi:hypothetical protein
MYLEIKTDDPEEIRRAFSETISKGQQAMLTLGKDGDFWSLSINTTVGNNPPPVISSTDGP